MITQTDTFFTVYKTMFIILIYVIKVRHLEENGAAMADDLVQKALIIQTYVMENKAGTYILTYLLSWFRDSSQTR